MTIIEIDNKDNFDLLFDNSKENRRFVDVGGYNGDTVTRALDINPNLRIIVIEPIKSLADIIKQKFQSNKNVTVINKAAWFDKCHIELNEYEGWAKGLSTIQPIMTQLRPFTNQILKYNIEADTLDNILSDCHIDTVDYLKIDTECSEEQILKGFSKYHDGTRFHIEHHITNLSNILQRLLEMDANIENITVSRDPNIPEHIIGNVIGKFTSVKKLTAPTATIIQSDSSDSNTQQHNQQYNQNNYQYHQFDRSYFEGIGYVGLYYDFPVHWYTLEKILDEKPQSVIDIGGARGYLIKKLNDIGIPATCSDISEHCFHTRATNNFVLHDITKIPWPFKDKEFDLCFSIATLEYIKEDKLYDVIKEMNRISRRGLHGITFEITSQDIDKTISTIRPKEWWSDKFNSIVPEYSVKIVSKKDLESGPINIPSSPDKLVKLNIGPYINMYHSWQNIDILDLNDFAKNNGYIFKQMDVTKGLLYENNSVDIIISSHFIEHLNREEGFNFLKECYRILKSDGIIRLTVPDTELLVKKYLDNTIGEYKHVNIGVENSPDNTQSLFELLLAGHKTIYDFNSLSKLLTKTGFINIEKKEFNKSRSKEIETQTIDICPTLSLYIEAAKSNTTIIEDIIKEPIITQGPIITQEKPIINTKYQLSNNTPLRIALISTPFFGVPPETYGGLEQIVWDLAEGLDELGYEVTIFAPEGSQSPKHGHLIITGPSISSVNVNWFEEEKKQSDVYSRIINDKNFDIIHGHGWFGFEYLLKMNNPNIKIIHTHHGGLNWESSPPFPKPNLVAISDYMRKYTEQYFKSKNFDISCRFVYNGIDINKYIFNILNKSNRLLFVGRFSKFKQPRVAIIVANKANLPIDLIGGTFVDDPAYIKELESMCDGNKVVMYKDVPHDFKIKKMQEAKALLFPSNMGEAFGLVALEAMACGTPVIALNDGAISEVVIHGKTGFICNDMEEMIDAIGKIDLIRNEDCRKRAEELSREKMAENYAKLYLDILNGLEW